MYFQVVTIEHSLERPQEELGDVTLSPVFRRVSVRCPVLHLFGYVHIPILNTSLQALSSSWNTTVSSAEAAIGTATSASGLLDCTSDGQPWRNEVVPLATLLEPMTRYTTPSTPQPAPPLVSAQRLPRPNVILPPPKSTSHAVHVAELSEGNETAAGGYDSMPMICHAPAKSRSLSAEILDGCTRQRTQYTQRRACLHVHGVYPSFLLPQYDGNVSAEQLAAQLETVVVRQLARQGVVIPNQQLVHDVRVVHRYNVYGYRPHAYAFYQVELIDPYMITKVVDILQNTREVGGRKWQLYDAHIKYHTQFMVHRRINGVAPFPLPVQRCHVRLPTSTELRQHPLHQTSSTACDRQHDGRSSSIRDRNLTKVEGDEAAGATFQGAGADGGKSGSGVTHSSYTGPSPLRFWRSDELGRLTTAEVEMDVCARDLGEPSVKGDAAGERDDDATAATKEDETDLENQANSKAHRRNSGRSVSTGDNLSYTRRIIRQYFKEYGVPDALRVADTIAMERLLQAKAVTPDVAVGGARESGATTNAGLLHSLLRYGNVTQIQRADPTVRWMRHRMLEYLDQRRAALGSVISTKTTAGVKDPSSLIAEGDEGAEIRAASDEAVQPSDKAPSLCFSTVSFNGGIIPAMSAEQQREQRAIRARMVAEYSKPGGSHHHSRFARNGTVPTYSEGTVVVPAQLPTYAEMGAGAILAMGGNVRNPSGCAACPENPSGDAIYIGFSSDSLQPSPSQETPTQLSAHAALNAKGGDVKAETASASEIATPSQPWLRGTPVEGVKADEVASTQDLMAALVARSPLSLESTKQVTEGVALSPELPHFENDGRLIRNTGVVSAEGGTADDDRYVSFAPLLDEHFDESQPGDAVVGGLHTAKISGECIASTASPLVVATHPSVGSEVNVSQASSWPSWSSWSSWSSDSSPSFSLSEEKPLSKNRENANCLVKPKNSSMGSREAEAQNTQRPLKASRVAEAVLFSVHLKSQMHNGGEVEALGHDKHSLQENPTQYPDNFQTSSSQGFFDINNNGRSSAAQPSPFTSPIDEENGETDYTTQLPLSNGEVEEGEGRSVSQRGEDDVIREEVRFPSQLTDAGGTTTTTFHYAVGDCVAFVQMRREANQKQGVSVFASAPQQVNATTTTVECDVLAIARIASLDEASAHLQWFLTLAETHLADNEAALVRRGAWVRLTRCATVPQTTEHGEACTEANAVRLGEMLLGDKVDTAPLSVLDDVLPTALSYTAAQSAPTRRLSPENIRSVRTQRRQSFLRGETPLEVDKSNSEEQENIVVRVWPVQCCVDLRSYEGITALKQNLSIQLRQRTHLQQQQSTYPHLRILCRYQYFIEARVLTAVPNNCFTNLKDSVPHCFDQKHGQRASPGNTTLHDRNGKSTHAQALRNIPLAPMRIKPAVLNASASRSPRHLFMRKRASRVLYTQPELLPLIDDGEFTGEDAGTTDAPSFCPANGPFLRDADSSFEMGFQGADEVGSTESSVPPAAVFSKDVLKEDDEGEHTLLFLSSSSDDVESGAAMPQQRPSAEEKSIRKEHLELLSSLAKASERLSDQQQRHNLWQQSSGASQEGRNAQALSSQHLVSHTLSQPQYRISTLRMPTDRFTSVSVCVKRSVQSAARLVAEELQSQEQLRWHHHCSALSGAVQGGEKKRRSSGLTSPTVSFSKASLSMDADDHDNDSVFRQSVQPQSGTNDHASQRTDLSIVQDGSDAAEGVVLIESISQPSLLEHHSVRDSTDVERETGSFLSLASTSTPADDAHAVSQASSVEAVGVMTPSQRTFLELFRSAVSSNKSTNDNSNNYQKGRCLQGTILQKGGSLGPVVDGVARWFRVTASAGNNNNRNGTVVGDVESDEEGGQLQQQGAPPRRPQPVRVSSTVRMQVSAVTWPLVAPPTSKTIGMSCAEQIQFERVDGATSTPPTSATSLQADAATWKTTTKEASLPKPSALHERKSENLVQGLSLSVTQHPQHYLQCVLRVQYIEVLLNRRPGETLVSTSDVLAVGLGQATTTVDSPIGVRVFCVAPTTKSSQHEKHAACVVAEESKKTTVNTATTTAVTMALPELHLRGVCASVQVVTVADEAALLTRVRDEILAFDPDILLSWEGYKYGLGYLALRYRAVLQRSLAADLSRILLHHGCQPKVKPPCPSLRSDGYKTRVAPAVTGWCDGVGAGQNSDNGSAFSLKLPHGRQATGSQRNGADDGTDVSIGAIGDGLQAGNGKGVHVDPVSSQIESLIPHHVLSSASSASSAVLNDFERDVDNGDDDSDTNLNTSALEGGGTHGCTGPHLGGWRSRGGWVYHQAPQQQRQYPNKHQQKYGVGCPWASTVTRGATSEPADAATSYSRRFGANVHITGRICTSLGKDLRKYVKMPSYSLPMVHAELFEQPLPYFSDTYLAELFHSPQDPGERDAALRYLAARVAAPHRIACRLRWFTKLLEFSRMYGILTEEVLTRGSQFRVEATLLRLAHPLKYAMLSPSMLQVHRQPRIECIPLVMQPKADFYRREDPIVVLDFRSLYPSIIIAYNLCYTTCLGMVQPTAHGRLGVLTNFTQRDSLLAELLPDDGVQHDSVVFTPNGAMFVPPSTRVGLVPRMVQAVLDTRFEVQASLRHVAEPMADTSMQQRLQEQQLALKMLANVTYGYTAASFTGRMPCVDLAEAIVSLGRQTLERAIALIHSTSAWRAEVVYGDTDSLFVRLHRRSLAEAFEIGRQMADAVTQSNPSPIRLQFEKVLSPCLLLVKKRYAGYMWTSPAQTSPIFLAKGIEVVRRDQCPATVKLMRRMLHLLFDGNTTATLKHVYYSEVEKMQAGAVNPLLCIFRRAVKLGRYGRGGDSHLPLAARLALKQMEKDVTETPYWGELLPYVVVRSSHSMDNLTDQVLHPAHLLYLNDRHSLDTSYYITRNINSSLDRMFYLVGISFAQWYQAMPRRRTAHAALLNLPTFLKAQEQLGMTTAESIRLPSAPRQRDLQDKTNNLNFAVHYSAADVRLNRITQLTAHMQQLLHQPTDPRFARSQIRRLLSAERVISDDDDNGEAQQHRSKRGRFEVEEVERGTRKPAGEGSGPAPSPVEVEDLTRPTVHEFVDVEQLMVTQCAPLLVADEAVTRQELQQEQNQRHESQLLPQRSPLQQRRGNGARVSRNGVTLDTYYPRTLCVVCVKVVSLDDIRRQREVLAFFEDRTPRVSAEGPSAGERNYLRKEGGLIRDPSMTAASVDVSSSSSTLFPLPPICNRCWSDPFSLYLHVQEQCRSFGQQLNSLQRICASCIGSGGDWGPHARALYKMTITDMEDMGAFSSARAESTQSVDAAATYTAGSVPRHLLTAAHLSARGVPQGCVSIDCAVGFEKKWVTEQWQQWQAVQRFLRRVM